MSDIRGCTLCGEFPAEPGDDLCQRCRTAGPAIPEEPDPRAVPYDVDTVTREDGEA